ncbi:hypothetical protein [Actinacidiphila soli]|uniref:hypothetical protein n=1 Tax=Actinacidiphila soli TaxID=2487275 RepID=UPI001F0B8371|nr:hypothetical protein [Actinacidiphila soli]
MIPSEGDWVVELILDLIDFTPDKDLCGAKLVEPAPNSLKALSMLCRAAAEPLSRSTIKRMMQLSEGRTPCLPT